MTSQITLRKPLLPYLIGILVIMQLLDPTRIWTALLVMLGGAWLLGYIWIRLIAGDLNLKREMRFGWAQVGDRLEERFTLENRGPVPALWVEVRDLSNMPGYNPSRVSQVGSQGTMRWNTQGICQRRGLFTIGPTLLRTSDPFGIYKLELHAPASMTLMVMPPVIPLPQIDIAAGGLTGAGRPRSDAPERTVSAASVRAYAAGDNLRWIHWPTSARRNDLYVRVFEGTPAGDWWIFLDLEARVQAGENWDSTTEHAILLAASLTDRGLQEQKAVGLAANGAEVIWLPPDPGSSQRWKILQRLALAEPGEQSLALMLARNRSAIRQQNSLILITPNPQGEWVQALVPLLWRGIIPTVILLDPNTYGGGGDIRPVMSLLTKLGIHHYRFTHQDLDRPEARPGQRGQWEWRVSATGKALPLRRPGDLGWRVLK